MARLETADIQRHRIWPPKHYLDFCVWFVPIESSTNTDPAPGWTYFKPFACSQPRAGDRDFKGSRFLCGNKPTESDYLFFRIVVDGFDHRQYKKAIIWNKLSRDFLMNGLVMPVGGVPIITCQSMRRLWTNSSGGEPSLGDPLVTLIWCSRLGPDITNQRAT